VCIARAIILEPEFVVADEPVSMVDASNRAEILQLLRELQERKGIAFLYITHDIASARHFSDRMAVMYLGTIVETGSTRQVIDKAMHPYTRGLLAAVPEPDPENRNRLRPVVPGEPPSASAVPGGCPFHPRCPAFMKGRCEISRPELEEVSSGYRVACFLYT
jgi:oligopeptide/dipeptide ABC transporter ATP-binding protein